VGSVSHFRRLILSTPPPLSPWLSDATNLELLATSSEHTVCRQTAHDSRQRKEVGLAQRYRLSILLSPTHRAVCPGTRLSRIPAIPDRRAL